MDIVFCQDFFPEMGGAHLWLYEVYKRWPSPVVVVAQDYHRDGDLCEGQNQFDSVDHGSLRIIRKDIRIGSINFLDPRCLKQYVSIVQSLKKLAGKSTLTIHSLRAFPEGMAALMTRALRVGACRVVTYAHGEEVLISKTSKQLYLVAKLVYRNSDVTISNSDSTKNLVKGICPRANVVALHPGVDAESFNIPSQERAEQRQKWGWSNDHIVLITVARMEPRKNHASVLKAIARLRNMGLPLCYVIGGTGEEESNLLKMVKELNLSEWVKFLGRVSEEKKRLYFASADIHIMPSIKVGPLIEGFGIVFMEAAAAGIPSIAGNVGGQGEAVIHGKTGLIIDGSNHQELEAAIRKLCEDVDLRKEMGQNGRIWAKRNDWEIVAHRTFELIIRASRPEGGMQL